MAKNNEKEVFEADYQEVNEDGTVKEETKTAETEEKDEKTLFEKHPRLGFGVKVVLVTLTAGAGAFAAYKFGKSIKEEAKTAKDISKIALGRAKEASDAVKRLEETAKPVVQNVIETVPEEVVPEVIDAAKDTAETVINN